MAVALNNLASLYCAQYRYVMADPLYRRALAIMEDRLGPEHPETAACLMNLGSVYSRLGRFDEAEKMYKRALAIREKALGRQHPEAVQSRAHLDELRSVRSKAASAASQRAAVRGLFE